MNGAVYYIYLGRKKGNTAGKKAPDDVARICRHRGYTGVGLPGYPAESHVIFQILWVILVCPLFWACLLVRVKRGDTVIYQYPTRGKSVANKVIPLMIRLKKCTMIALVHDLESLRGGIEGLVNKQTRANEVGDNIVLKKFDKIICHNSRMKEYLISQGFEEDKLIELEIFDYLTGYKEKERVKGDSPSIAIAGSLARGKCGYIYQIHDAHGEQNENLVIHLYGVGYEESQMRKNEIYHGSFKPEELPGRLEGDFGLVWDGTSAETCAGNTGEYLKYNNPHKTSLYLAAGLPVVVWSRAAVASGTKSTATWITCGAASPTRRIPRARPTVASGRKTCHATRISRSAGAGYFP